MSKPKGHRAAEGKTFLLKAAYVMGNKKTNVVHSAFIGKGMASATSCTMQGMKRETVNLHREDNLPCARKKVQEIGRSSHHTKKQLESAEEKGKILKQAKKQELREEGMWLHQVTICRWMGYTKHHLGKLLTGKVGKPQKTVFQKKNWRREVIIRHRRWYNHAPRTQSLCKNYIQSLELR